MGSRTVLIVDDEPGFLDILRMVLTRNGFQVLSSLHGSEGLDMLYRYRPHLALLDDMLPGISGGDICLQVKNDPSVAHIPVILYSAGPRVRDSEFVRHIRADAVLFKPFKPLEVVNLINRCLDGAPV